MLLSNGADRTISSTDKDGLTPIHLAVQKSIDCMRNQNREFASAPYSINNLTKGAFWFCTARCADVQAQDRNGQTPLHYAALAGHVESGNMLLSNGESESGVCVCSVLN
jgi:ankyrin repeat protein